MQKCQLKENSHKLLDKEGNEVQPGQTTPAYAEDGVTPVGTYSIDPATGEVTFHTKLTKLILVK